MNHKLLGFSAILVIVIVVAIVLQPATSYGLEGVDSIELYKESNCGCCSIYSNYLDGKIDADFNVKSVTDIAPVKERYGVPNTLKSCHTTVIGEYFVEGHIPVEAIAKLLEEQPDIKGIAMPGMPSGSPGMPGGKKGPFVVYAVNNDGTHEEFMRL